MLELNLHCAYSDCRIRRSNCLVRHRRCSRPKLRRSILVRRPIHQQRQRRRFRGCNVGVDASNIYPADKLHGSIPLAGTSSGGTARAPPGCMIEDITEQNRLMKLSASFLLFWCPSRPSRLRLKLDLYRYLTTHAWLFLVLFSTTHQRLFACSSPQRNVIRHPIQTTANHWSCMRGAIRVWFFFFSRFCFLLGLFFPLYNFLMVLRTPAIDYHHIKSTQQSASESPSSSPPLPNPLEDYFSLLSFATGRTFVEGKCEFWIWEFWVKEFLWFFFSFLQSVMIMTWIYFVSFALDEVMYHHEVLKLESNIALTFFSFLSVSCLSWVPKNCLGD